MVSLDGLSARQIAAGVAAGDFSAVEVAKASLSALDAREPQLHAFLQRSEEQLPDRKSVV